jgi:hypothetical protein
MQNGEGIRAEIVDRAGQHNARSDRFGGGDRVVDHWQYLRGLVAVAGRVGGMDDQYNAVRGAKDVGCVHRISGDPFDCRGSGLRAAGQTSHRPSTPRERRGGRTSDAARGTDNEGNLAG